jgi:hypothetical protein
MSLSYTTPPRGCRVSESEDIVELPPARTLHEGEQQSIATPHARGNMSSTKSLFLHSICTTMC